MKNQESDFNINNDIREINERLTPAINSIKVPTARPALNRGFAQNRQNRSSLKITTRIVAAVAAFALIFTGGASLLLAQSAPSVEYVSSAKDYNQVYSAIKNIQRFDNPTVLDALLGYAGAILTFPFSLLGGCTKSAVRAPGAVGEDALNDGVNEETAAKNDYDSSSDGKTPDHSGTNNQVENVEEADLVKTDGNYIYALYGRQVRIVRAENGKLTKSAVYNLEGLPLASHQQATEMFVYNNRIALIVQEYSYQTKNGNTVITEGTTSRGSASAGAATMPDGQTYSQDSASFPNGQIDPATTPSFSDTVSSGGATTIDGVSQDDSYLTEPSYGVGSPDTAIYYDGDYAYATASKTQVYILDISDRTKPTFARTVTVDGSYISSRMIDNDLFLVTSKKVSRDIDKDNPATFIPTVAQKDEQTQDSYCIQPADITIAPNPDSANYVTAASFDITKNDSTVGLKSVLGSADKIYSSVKNLYVASTRYTSRGSNKTDILRFSINKGDLSHTGKCEVNGYTYSQFGMDEYDGYFRIATTGRSGFTSDNNLYIYDSELKLCGKVEGLARDESIYSVRFMGKMGYIVTFRETDPLFALDLSNPRDPKVLGQLKIPGFSSYLHPYDDTHLIGIGKGENRNTKLSLFDVSDPKNPTELTTYEIADVYDTPAETNHKAVLFDKKRDILAFTILSDTFDTNLNRSRLGLNVFSITPENGFVLKAIIPPQKAENTLDATALSHSRSLYIGDYLYYVTPYCIISTNLNGFKHVDKIIF